MATGNFIVGVNIRASVANSEPRSGVALKHAIQKTTQSHLTLATSKKKKDMCGGKEKGGHLFGNTAKGVEDNVMDEGEDKVKGDSDDSCCFDSKSDKESVRESHSLTFILIGEDKCVLLLFYVEQMSSAHSYLPIILNNPRY